MRVASTLLLALLLWVPTARAETVGPEEQPDVLARLGTPARAEVVHTLLAGLAPEDTNAAVRIAHALGHAGGCDAVAGCLRLLDHGAVEARLAAIEAAGRAGLRLESLARRLRRTVREGGDHEVRAAVEALGHVGDGRDVPTLLDLTESESSRMRAAAFHALEDLTGAKMPFVRARWVWYWKGFSDRADRLLPQVLAALEDAVDGPDRQALAALVRRYGWVDAAEVRLTVREWLVSPDRELRAIACRLVGELRLADLASETRECLRFAVSREHRQIALDALGVLGHPVEEGRFSTPGD